MDDSSREQDGPSSTGETGEKWKCKPTEYSNIDELSVQQTIVRGSHHWTNSVTDSDVVAEHWHEIYYKLINYLVSTQVIVVDTERTPLQKEKKKEV